MKGLVSGVLLWQATTQVYNTFGYPASDHVESCGTGADSLSGGAR